MTTQAALLPLREIDDCDASLVSPPILRLAQAAQVVPVVPGFVLTHHAFEHFLKASNRGGRVATLISELANAQPHHKLALVESLRAEIVYTDLPPGLSSQIIVAKNELIANHWSRLRKIIHQLRRHDFPLLLTAYEASRPYGRGIFSEQLHSKSCSAVQTQKLQLSGSRPEFSAFVDKQSFPIFQQTLATNEGLFHSIKKAWSASFDPRATTFPQVSILIQPATTEGQSIKSPSQSISHQQQVERMSKQLNHLFYFPQQYKFVLSQGRPNLISIS